MKDPAGKDPLTDDVIRKTAEHQPIAAAVGAVGGTLTGAALGSALGPLGALTGAAIGSVAGAIAGKGISEGIEPDAETAYWQRRYREEPYYQAEYTFDDYGPAYGLGRRLYAPDVSFELAEQAMSSEWERSHGTSRLSWSHARDAARASWERRHSMPGD